MAELQNQHTVARELRQGLANRLDLDYEIVQNPKAFPKMDIQDIPAEFIHAYNVGVPLTSNELRFVYQRLHQAYVGMLNPAYQPTFNLFDTKTPDGKYSYDAPSIGLYFYTLAPMIGSCSSAWSQTTQRPPFDCEKLKIALQSF
jgi:hypothetical protein